MYNRGSLPVKTTNSSINHTPPQVLTTEIIAISSSVPLPFTIYIK